MNDCQSYKILLVFSPLLFCCLIIALCGCAINNKSPILRNGEHRQILESQKQKALIAEEEESKTERIMTASDYKRWGDAYLKQGNTDMAFIHYNKSLYLDPNQNDVRYKTGVLFLKKGLIEEAKKEFNEIVNNSSNDSLNALAYFSLGCAFFKAGDHKKAKDNYLQAINLDANLWEAHNFLGIVYNHQHLFDAAIAQFTEAIAIKPNISILFNNLGISFFLKGEYDKSVRSFSEALQLDEQNNKIYNNLALALFKLGKYTEAFEAFQKGESDIAAYNNLGYMYMAEGNNNKAIEYFKKAIEINPKFYVTAHENLQQANRHINTIHQ